MDAVFAGVIVVFMAVTIGLAVACDKLGEKK